MSAAKVALYFRGGRLDPKDFVAKRRKQITLPSGQTITVKRIELSDLLVLPEIPVPLIGKLDAVIGGTSKSTPTENAEFLLWFFRMAVVDPKLGDVTDDEHVSVYEFTASERQFVFDACAEDSARIAATFPES